MSRAAPVRSLGPYELKALIGRGGMGEVYRAHDSRLGREVAIKILPQGLASDPKLRERFEREARAVSSLNHPHICTLYDIGSQDGIAYLVMEYLEGETLEARLAKGRLPLDQALTLAIEIAGALDAAHRKGVVHRDLKPGNIMLTKSGAKLLDFGLARIQKPAPLEDETVTLGVTTPGTILGTFQYMSPEQLEAKEADARSDIFAFGAVLYEMLTGRKAFEGKSKASLIAAIMHSEPASVSELQPMTPLDRVVKTCLVKDPDDRWQSARDLKRELEWVGPAIGAPAQAQTRGMRHLAKALGILAILAVLAAIVFALLYLRATPLQERSARYQIALPGNATGVNQLHLSPDGRYLAIAAGGAGGARLWVRPLDSLEARALPGTEDASFPFWSPDSAFIGFFAQGKLQKIALAGGRRKLYAMLQPDSAGAGTATA
jgi:eukaryotic-like serine/threonine-protein kinase